MAGPDEIFADLEAEQDRLEAILAGLAPADWLAESGAAGWTVRDVVVHLAQTEEFVVASAIAATSLPRTAGVTLDQTMDQLVRGDDAGPAHVLDRWRTARRAAINALRLADPRVALPWAAAALKPRTLATTRLAEHWAHGLDITEPLRVAFPDTPRLRHVAWLAFSSLPYACAQAGQPLHEVFCDLTAPDGQPWRFGPATASSRITGSAGAFCRVAVRRLAAEQSGLVAQGPHAWEALRVLRTYAV